VPRHCTGIGVVMPSCVQMNAIWHKAAGTDTRRMELKFANSRKAGGRWYFRNDQKDILGIRMSAFVPFATMAQTSMPPMTSGWKRRKCAANILKAMESELSARTSIPTGFLRSAKQKARGPMPQQETGSPMTPRTGPLSKTESNFMAKALIPDQAPYPHRWS